MSTRANIIVVDNSSEIFFYRHSDGYPSGALPPLLRFMELIEQGKLRDNAEQSAGWIVLFGAEEYGVTMKGDRYGYGWKCGSMEPATGLCDWCEYFYTINVQEKTLQIATDIERENVLWEGSFSDAIIFSPDFIEKLDEGEPIE